MCDAGKYFIIIFLMIVFLIIYVFLDPNVYKRKESFSNPFASSYSTIYPKDYSEDITNSAPVFMKPHSMEVYQGVSIPTKYKPTESLAYDKSLPPVDGNSKGLRSMYMFAYNKCSPECCKESPYSCSGGCVCMSDKQMEFLDNRGDNREPNKCMFEGKH